MRHRNLILLAVLAAAVPQEPVRSQASPVGASVVSGTVYDSIGGRPLAGATVQLLAGRDLVRSVATDRDGGFTIRELAAGRYLLGFMHPVLDSLGIEPPVRSVRVGADDSVAVPLAVPSAERIRHAACGGAGDSAPAMLMGVVRHAGDGAAVHGAVVEGVWLEFGLRREAITRRLARTADTTQANGWFALCGVPRGGSLSVRASHDADSSSFVELEVPDQGFLRRDLYVGPTTIAAADSSGTRRGSGELRGWVLTEQRGEPLADAIVGIVGGPATRANDSGAWTLTQVPIGTHLLEVRAVGYYPLRVPIDVLPGTEPVFAALTAFETVLDTVRIRANRVHLEGTGFAERSRSGAGRYLTADDLAHRAIINTSDVFQTIPGLRLDRMPLGDTRLTMRSPLGRCTPSVYIDGLRLQRLSADDVDSFVSPDEIAAIEVYAGSVVPAEFQGDMDGCGSIVIWTKPGRNPARGWSWRRRLLHGASAILLGIGIGALVIR